MTAPESPFGLDSWFRLWADAASRMMGAASGALGPAGPVDAAEQMRSALLGAWGEAWNRFLRSPEFLELMRQSLGAAVETRRQVNDALGQMHYQFQSASRQDVDQTLRQLRHLEHRLSDSLERVAARLDDLDSRLQALGDGAARRPAPASAPRRPGKRARK